MILKLTLFVVVVNSLYSSCLGSPQYQYRYGVPTLAAPAPFAAAPPPPPPPAPFVPRALPVQEDPGALELLPPLQHVVGTKYPAVSPGKGYKFPRSQLLNFTPPPNLKH